MNLAVKIGLGALGLAAISGVALGFYYFARAIDAGIRLLNECGDYDCEECPTSGLCGLDNTNT